MPYDLQYLSIPKHTWTFASRFGRSRPNALGKLYLRPCLESGIQVFKGNKIARTMALAARFEDDHTV